MSSITCAPQFKRGVEYAHVHAKSSVLGLGVRSVRCWVGGVEETSGWRRWVGGVMGIEVSLRAGAGRGRVEERRKRGVVTTPPLRPLRPPLPLR